MLLVGRARILSVAVFNKQVNNGRSSELCSAMFLTQMIQILSFRLVYFEKIIY